MNKEIKFKTFLDHALKIGASHIATGHYARVKNSGGRYRLLKAKDTNKDQTYFLHVLTQVDLSQTLFPLADFKKNQVRELALKYKLPVATRPDSQDLCFVGQGSYRDFLRKIDPTLLKPGTILDEQGNKI